MSARDLRQAVRTPHLASVGAEDTQIVADVLQFHIDKTGAELAAIQHKRRTGEARSVNLIAPARWRAILDGFRADTMRVTDLSPHEILAIDNDDLMKAAFEMACDEGWSK